ncbi:MAG: glycosyltransferase family 9 protein [Planctomycetes bacterium]|nr:glycosyltransferase family 9 protein [Planctomycetota bacterium]
MNAFDQILFLHAGALGDCVLALHLAQRVRTAQPNAKVAMAARSPIVRWARNHGFIDEAHLLDGVDAAHWHSKESHPPEESVRFLRSFDCIMSLLGGPDDSITHRLRELSGKPVYAIGPKPSPGVTSHVVDQWVDRLHDVGLALAERTPHKLANRFARESDSGAFRLTPLRPPLLRGKALTASLRARLGKSATSSSGDAFAIFHPGSGGLKKVLPIDEIEKLADIVRARGSTVVWMIGPDEMERDGEALIKRLSLTAPVIAEEDVCKAADLVAGADEFIGFDAGMTHVAAMAGVPTTAIFSPTDPRVWRPLGPDVRIANFNNAADVLAQGFAAPSDGGGSSFCAGGAAGFGEGAGDGAGGCAGAGFAAGG